jgi:hypothetical protein
LIIVFDAAFSYLAPSGLYIFYTRKNKKKFGNLVDFFSSSCYIKIFNRKGDVYPLQVGMEKIEKNQLTRFIGKGGSSCSQRLHNSCREQACLFRFPSLFRFPVQTRIKK